MLQADALDGVALHLYLLPWAQLGQRNAFVHRPHWPLDKACSAATAKLGQKPLLVLKASLCNG